MSGNGRRIPGTTVTAAPRWTGPPGQAESTEPVFFEAGPGAVIRGTSARRTATGTHQSLGTVIMASGLPGRCIPDLSYASGHGACEKSDRQSRGRRLLFQWWCIHPIIVTSRRSSTRDGQGGGPGPRPLWRLRLYSQVCINLCNYRWRTLFSLFKERTHSGEALTLW